jgi:hypothetical protein
MEYHNRTGARSLGRDGAFRDDYERNGMCLPWNMLITVEGNKNDAFWQFTVRGRIWLH